MEGPGGQGDPEFEAVMQSMETAFRMQTAVPEVMRFEDETGSVNIIVWASVADPQRKPLLGATLLTVYGQWQRQGEGDNAVMHLLAARMIDHTPLLQGLVSRSRDFR